MGKEVGEGLWDGLEIGQSGEASAGGLLCYRAGEGTGRLGVEEGRER